MKHKRIVVTRYGGPEVLELVEEECPEPGRGEVRIRVLAAGVSLPDVMAREGVHPETPQIPFTPGWDLVGVVDRAGPGVSGIETGRMVAALPIHGAYAEFICLPAKELYLVPPNADVSEAVSLGLNYVTAYQMLHRSARVRAGQRALVHGASGGVGTALLQLGGLAGLEMYGTCSSRGAAAVSRMNCTSIDYRNQDFVREIHRLTGEGVDVVFDPIGGKHLWESRKCLRPGGRVVGYGHLASIREGGISAMRTGRRQRLRGTATFAKYIVASYILPGRKWVVPYSIQTLKRLNPGQFREDLTALLDLLGEKKIKPIISRQFPLAEARQAHELLEKGGTVGKIVLLTS